MTSASIIPRAKGLPFLGSAWPLLRDPLGFLYEQHRQHGPVFEVRAPRRSFVVLAGRDANRFASREGREVLVSEPFWRPLTRERQCPHMVLGVDGADHQTLRKLHSRDVSKAVVDAHVDTLMALTEQELGAQVGQTISARHLLRMLVSRQVHHLLSDGDDPAPADVIEDLIEVFRWETNALLLGKWPRVSLRLPQHIARTRRADAFLDDLVRAAEHAPPEGWFASVMKGRERYPHLFEDGDVRTDFMLPFVAGVDTVGATLALMLAEVLTRPRLMDRIVAAVDQVWERGRPSVGDLRESDDLRGLMLETLRMHPSAFAVYRQAKSAFTFAGCQVPAGSDVLLFTTGTHRDSRYFEDPDTFDITRYRPPRDEHRQPHVFMPYGAGPHICLGAGMGEALLLVGAAVMLRFFRFEAEGLEHALRRSYDPSLVVDPRFRVSVIRR